LRRRQKEGASVNMLVLVRLELSLWCSTDFDAKYETKFMFDKKGEVRVSPVQNYCTTTQSNRSTSKSNNALPTGLNLLFLYRYSCRKVVRRPLTTTVYVALADILSTGQTRISHGLQESLFVMTKLNVIML